MMCLDNGPVLSKNRRKQYIGQVPENVFDFIERCSEESLSQGAFPN